MFNTCAFIDGFIKAANAVPQYFEPAQKPGFNYPLWTTLMPPGYVPPLPAGQAGSILDRMNWRAQDAAKMHNIMQNPASIFSKSYNLPGQLAGVQGMQFGN